MKLRVVVSKNLSAALIRAGRTAGQTFAGFILAVWVKPMNEKAVQISVTGLVETIIANADYAGGAAIFAALGALGLNLKRPGPVSDQSPK